MLNLLFFQMKLVSKTIIAIAISIWTLDANAQLSLTGQYIPRLELRHGFKTLTSPSQAAALFVSHRARLIMGYTQSKYKFNISVQDVRTWGSQSQLNLSDNLLSIHEIWAEIFLKEKISLKLGRQELVYDDHRIFGNVDWTMQGRSHDIALFKYSGDEMKLHLGLGFNQDSEQLFTTVYTNPNNYKTLQFLWMNNKFSEQLNASFLVLNNGLQFIFVDQAGNTKYDTKFSQTIGGRVVSSGQLVGFSGAFYFQIGKDGNNQDVSAYNLLADVSYKVTDQLTLTAGVELLSGTSQTDLTNTKNNSFNPFYGTNHKFNGFMDYYFVANHINNVGLQDIFIKLGYKKDKHTASIVTHLFSSNDNILNSAELAVTGNSVARDSSLGTEIDFTYVFVPSPDIAMQLGYSQMFATSSLVELKGGSKSEISNWVYLMLKITPDFLKKVEDKEN